MVFGEASALGWNAITANKTTGKKKFDEKLKFAFKKRNIVYEEMKRLRTLANGLTGNLNRNIKKIKNPKLAKMNPFIKLYLKVYREFCGKYEINDIMKEVEKRWTQLPKEKLSEEIKTDNPENEKVQLALRKRNILSQEINRLSNVAVKARKKKSRSNSFLKCYFDVYRELCGKCDTTEISKAAEKKWRTQSYKKHSKSKSNFAKKHVQILTDKL